MLRSHPRRPHAVERVLNAARLEPTHTAAGRAIRGCAGRAYVTHDGDGTVSVIDTASGVVSATIPVGKNPGRVAIWPS
jgi:YVTN family beta-propeller protein